MTPAVVYDCMIYLQAAGGPTGPAGRCVALAWDGRAKLTVSRSTLDEVRDVLTRPATRRKFPALTPEAVDTFLTRTLRSAVLIDPVPAVVTLSRDPKDAKYLDLAVAAGAELVVSRDNDLLDMMTGSDPDAVAFRTTYPNVRILDPAAFLRSLDNPAPDPSP